MNQDNNNGSGTVKASSLMNKYNQVLDLLNKQNVQNDDIKKPLTINTTHLAGNPCFNVHNSERWIVNSGTCIILSSRSQC